MIDPPPQGQRDSLVVRGRDFEWGSRTYLMGIINVTPDSFSGDGLLSGQIGSADATHRALALARSMVADGADILDVGGESTRPGHRPVTREEEMGRVADVIAAIRSTIPEIVISVDTRKPEVAEAALEAGADMVNDVAATLDAGDMARLVAGRGVPYVISHMRSEANYRSVVDDVVADLAAAMGRATGLGCPLQRLILDPGIGFGKTAQHNLELLNGLSRLRVLGRPILLGASRKSTIGVVLDLPPQERLEGTLATTALGIAAGADIVRVHDVKANLRVARMSDAIVRGTWSPRG